ncbi:MAG: hypothetical protein AAF772_02645, partial [Acidobacteriota bacterium]
LETPNVSPRSKYRAGTHARNQPQRLQRQELVHKMNRSERARFQHRGCASLVTLDRRASTAARSQRRVPDLAARFDRLRRFDAS